EGQDRVDDEADRGVELGGEGLVRGRELRLELLEDLQLERLFIHHSRRGGSRPARLLAGESSEQLLLLLHLLLDASELFLQKVEFLAELLVAGPLRLGARGAGRSREEQGEEQRRAGWGAATGSPGPHDGTEGGRLP